MKLKLPINPIPVVLSDEYIAALKAKPLSKYGNKPQVVDGVRHASKAEQKRDWDLHIMEKRGEIVDLKRQPRFPLVVNGQLICIYISDWSYRIVLGTGEPGHLIAEDRKGFQTRDFKIKFKLAKALHSEIEWRIS